MKFRQKISEFILLSMCDKIIFLQVKTESITTQNLDPTFCSFSQREQGRPGAPKADNNEKIGKLMLNIRPLKTNEKIKILKM